MRMFSWLLVLFILGGYVVMSSAEEKQEEKLVNFDALWDYNNPKETEKKFRDLLPIAEKSGDASYFAQLLTQIARTEGLQGKFEDARKTLDSVEALLTPESTTPRIRFLLEKGRVCNSSGKAVGHRQPPVFP